MTTHRDGLRIVLVLGGFCVLVGLLVMLPLWLRTDSEEKVVGRKVLGRGGLYLTDCRIVQASATNVVPKAVLEVKPTLRLVWEGGALDI